MLEVIVFLRKFCVNNNLSKNEILCRLNYLYAKKSSKYLCCCESLVAKPEACFLCGHLVCADTSSVMYDVRQRARAT